MSSGTKVLLIVGIVFVVPVLMTLAVLALLFCGGLIGFATYKAKDMPSDVPTIVAAKTKEITEINIPSALNPVISDHVPGFMTMVFYGDKAQNNSDNVLILAAFGSMVRGQNEQQMRQQLNQSMQQQGMNNQGEEVLVNRTIQKQVQVRGKQATFTISFGKGARTQRERIQVSGMFEGKSGPAMLMLNADAQKISEQDVNKMLESIR